MKTTTRIIQEGRYEESKLTSMFTRLPPYAERTTSPPDHKTPTSPLLIDMNHYDEHKGNFHMENYLPLAHTSATGEDNEGLVQRKRMAGEHHRR